jgi:beta-galactosidase
MAQHYRGHAGLGGYDVWNEANVSPAYCYCPATAEKFRGWLRQKYGELTKLGRAWNRPSLAEWEDVQPPRNLGPWPDVMDWLQFRIDQAYHWMRWRVETIRAADPDALIVAHGIASSLHNMAGGACDEWRSSAEVEGWGYTWGSSRHGDEPWKQWHAVDLVRAGSWSPSFNAGQRKPFWHAEAYAGPLWMQGNVLNKPRDEGRIASPEDVRLWGMQSFAAGATGLIYLRWRPLLDGPLFGAFGAYGMDGSRTERSAMAARLAAWVAAEEQQDLWSARPVQGDIGIVVAPESQLFCYAQQGSTDYYAHSAKGAYCGFFENNVQPDFVHVRDIDQYRALYLPFPAHLSAETAQRLKEWVTAGGTLISEGCPAYWGDGTHVSVEQPGYGLGEVFGATEAYVEFTPDILTGLTLEWNGIEAAGGIFLQTFDLAGGSRRGHYTGDVAGPLAERMAVVENTYGQGRTLLFGTFLGYGHYHAVEDVRERSRHFFAQLLEWAGVRQHVRVSSDLEDRSGRWWGPTARIHAPPAGGAGGTYLWVTNPGHEGANVQIELDERWAPDANVRVLWGDDTPRVSGTSLSLVVGARDAAVIRLR